MHKWRSISRCTLTKLCLQSPPSECVSITYAANMRAIHAAHIGTARSCQRACTPSGHVLQREPAQLVWEDGDLVLLARGLQHDAGHDMGTSVQDSTMSSCCRRSSAFTIVAVMPGKSAAPTESAPGSVIFTTTLRRSATQSSNLKESSPIAATWHRRQRPSTTLERHSVK